MARTPQGHAEWPDLPLDAWLPTLDTLHMWLQIVGKIKLKLTPFLNQWWNTTLVPTSRGLATGVIPYDGGAFEIEFDFINHDLFVRDSSGGTSVIGLRPQTVADFHRELMATLRASGIDVAISPVPVEVPHKIRFDRNVVHKDYDRAFVTRWWRILLRTTLVLQRFRSGFTGKSSPIHFFWGSFDLNHTRHSGRAIDPPAGAESFHLAENEENYSCGFWPGNISAAGLTYGEPAFYSYLNPEPASYRAAPVAPGPAYFDDTMGLFILRYDDLQHSADPDGALLEFFESTYAAGADAAGWDRRALERR